MKLLLISDERAQSDWIRRHLEFDNCQVSVSSDWQTGQTMLQQAPYDVVVFNVHRVDTSQFNGAVKTGDVPLLVIVSPDTPDNKAWGLEAGADDCVGYSVDIRELMARLHVLNRRRVGQLTALSALQLGDLELNLTDKLVYRSGKPINLLPREYHLLAFLMKNKGRVVSKKEIVENVWHTASLIRPNTVEVYINYLRNKIDRGSTSKLIHTVIGIGYIMRLVV